MSQKPTLIQQLLGAVGGGALALVLYSGYEWIKPPLAQVIVPAPEIIIADEAVHEAADGLEEDFFDTVTDRTLDILENQTGGSSSSDPSQVVVEPEDPLAGDVTASTADDLPDSGIGVLSAALVSFAATGAMYLQRKKKVRA